MPNRRNKKNNKGGKVRPKQQQQRKRNNNNQQRNKPAAKSAMPSAYCRVVKTVVPKIEHLPSGDCVITHTEQFDSLVTSSSAGVYQVTGYPMNPGLTAMFPWLSNIARNYESYKFLKFAVDYQPTCGTSESGIAIIGADYDALDTGPADVKTIMSYRSSKWGNTYKDFTHYAKAEDLSKNKTYFVRTGDAPGGSDLRLYDTGNVFVASQGDSNTSKSVGYLAVTYTIRLMTPSVLSAPTFGGAAMGEAKTATAPIPLGTTPTPFTGSYKVAFPPATDYSRVQVELPGPYVGSMQVTGTGLVGPTLFTNILGIVDVEELWRTNDGSNYTVTLKFIATVANAVLGLSLTAMATITAAQMVVSKIPLNLFPVLTASTPKLESKEEVFDDDVGDSPVLLKSKRRSIKK